MKFYLDTKIIHNNELIEIGSIGVVSEKGDTFYRVFKDFNLKEAWLLDDLSNVFDRKPLRETMLRVFFDDFLVLYENLLAPLGDKKMADGYLDMSVVSEFNQDNLKYLLDLFGATKEAVAKELLSFMNDCCVRANEEQEYLMIGYHVWGSNASLKLLYGTESKMSKRVFNLSHLVSDSAWTEKQNGVRKDDDIETYYKSDPMYPKKEREHHSLYGAMFARELHKFVATKPNMFYEQYKAKKVLD